MPILTRSIAECVDLASKHAKGKDISKEFGGDPSDRFLADFGPSSRIARSLNRDRPVGNARRKKSDE